MTMMTMITTTTMMMMEMMTMTKPTRNTKRPPQKFTLTHKLLLTTASLATFIGGWSVIAEETQDSQPSTTANTQNTTQPSPATPLTSQYQLPSPTPRPTLNTTLPDLPPIPTLSPLSLRPQRDQDDLAQANTLSQSAPTQAQVSLDALVLPTLAPMPTLAPLPTPEPPQSASVGASTAALSADRLHLLAPNGLATTGPVNFEWAWQGDLPAGYGFEVQVWQPGQAPLGAHDALADNVNGQVRQLGPNHYALSLDIRLAAGVQNRSGQYYWTVSLVQVSPNYVNSGVQAPPAVIYLDTGGGSNASGGGGGGGGQSAGNTTQGS
jgi:hypothetical protein